MTRRPRGGLWVTVALTLGALTIVAAPGAGDAQSTPVVSLSNGRLSVRVREAPLGEVLEHIVARSGISIAAAGNLDVPVSAYFEGIDADEAIRRLAGSHATVWVTVPAPLVVRGPSPVVAAPSRSAPSSTAPSDAQRFAAASRALRDPNPRVRARGVYGLGRLGTPEAVAALRAAVTDPEPSVRGQLVYALRRNEGDEVIRILSELAGGDVDRQVRMAAVRALAARRGAAVVPVLEWASRDPDPAIRRTAQRALTNMALRPSP